MSDIKKQKQELRKKLLKKLSNLSEKDKSLKSREINRLFYSNITTTAKSIIAGYMPFKDEVDIKLLLEMYEEQGSQVCLPLVEGKNDPLVFKSYKTGASLIPNSKYKFLEPKIGNAELIPNIIIIPLLAFDSAGNRLGRGAGFYDKTLEYLSGFAEFITIGVAYSCQQEPHIPNEKHDFKLDFIITEERVLTPTTNRN